ncbi:hypothetical protein LCL95_00750 [Bacillus timonensis]|nr:hypothetical protein [Bacillus timonensis]
MDISMGLLIFCTLVGFAVLYVIIESAVRRGIDSSETYELVRKILIEIKNEKKKS